MIPALLLLAGVVAAAGVVAVSAREPRLAALGALVVLVGVAYLADPLPDPVAVAARMTGAVLAGYLVWVALRQPGAPTVGWQIGWPGAAAIAAVAFLAGWLFADALGTRLAAGVGGGPGAGVASALAAGDLVPRATLAACASLVALGAAPVLVARDALRLGLGLLLLIGAAELLRHAVAGEADPVVELGMAFVVAAAGAAVAGLVSRALRTHGDLQLRSGAGRSPAVRHRAADEAHPLGPRPDDAA